MELREEVEEATDAAKLVKIKEEVCFFTSMSSFLFVLIPFAVPFNHFE